MPDPIAAAVDTTRQAAQHRFGKTKPLRITPVQPPNSRQKGALVTGGYEGAV